MDINELTLGQCKELAAMFGNKASEAEPTFTPHIGVQCIVRTYASGVHYGTVVAQSGRAVEIADARRLWRWHAKDGISLSDVAVSGIDASKSRICATVPTMTVLDALEIIPVSATAGSSIESAPVATK